MIDKARHHVLTAAHPSGLSASRGFFGCRSVAVGSAWWAGHHCAGLAG